MTAVGRFSNQMNGKFTDQLVQAVGATWHRGEPASKAQGSKSRKGATRFKHANPKGSFDFEIDWRTGKSSGGFYADGKTNKPTVWSGARRLFAGSHRIFIAGLDGFTSHKPTMSEWL